MINHLKYFLQNFLFHYKYFFILFTLHKFFNNLKTLI